MPTESLDGVLGQNILRSAVSGGVICSGCQIGCRGPCVERHQLLSAVGERRKWEASDTPGFTAGMESYWVATVKTSRSYPGGERSFLTKSKCAFLEECPRPLSIVLSGLLLGVCSLSVILGDKSDRSEVEMRDFDLLGRCVAFTPAVCL